MVGFGVGWMDGWMARRVQMGPVTTCLVHNIWWVHLIWDAKPDISHVITTDE